VVENAKVSKMPRVKVENDEKKIRKYPHALLAFLHDWG